MTRHWIGMFDQSRQNVFKWSDGTPFTYTNFAPGKPNSYNGGNFGECGESVNGEWHDDACASLTNRPYVCKVSYFNNAGGGNYAFFKKSKNWLDAQAHCKSIGANLVTIETEAENKYIIEQLKLK